MGYRRELLFLIPALASIFFIIDSNFFLSSNVQAQRQSQSTTNACNGDTDSCLTTICSNDQPCQTFPSDQPTFVQPARDAATMQPVVRIPAVVPQAVESIVTQPVGETSEIMQTDEETIVMQPVELTEQYIEATQEVCDDSLDNDIDGKVDNQDEDEENEKQYEEDSE